MKLHQCPDLTVLGLRRSAFKSRPGALFGPQGQEYFEPCLKGLSIRALFFGELDFLVSKSFVMRVLCHVRG